MGRVPGFGDLYVVVVVVSHIQRIGCQPEKTTLHGANPARHSILVSSDRALPLQCGALEFVVCRMWRWGSVKRRDTGRPVGRFMYGTNQNVLYTIYYKLYTI